MELLLDIKELQEIIEVLDEDKAADKAKKVVGLQENDKVECVNIGPGADVLVLMAVLSVSWTIFQLPGILKQSIEGWEWLVNKLKGFITRKQLVSLDIDGAGMLAIDYLADKFGEDANFNLMDAHCFTIHDISAMYPGREEILASHPHNYYVFTFYIASRILVLSVRSSGEIRELESFDEMPYGLKDYKE